MRERNFRCAHGEIDLIASSGEYVVFVEVKTRSFETPYHPTLAVTEAKKRQVRKLGRYYCDEHLTEALQPRFDVVAVTLRRGEDHSMDEAAPTAPRVEHFINAF